MAENTNNAQTQQRLSRAEIIKRNTENKKRIIDNNVNAAVFVSETKAGSQILTNLRMIDSIDSSIRRLWGVSIDMSKVSGWFDGIKEIQTKLAELEDLGVNLLVEANSPRDISNRFLRRMVVDKIEANAKAEKAAAKVAQTPSQTQSDDEAATKKARAKTKASQGDKSKYTKTFQREGNAMLRHSEKIVRSLS